MKHILFVWFSIAYLSLFATTNETQNSSGVPLISIIAIALAFVFLLVKNKFKGSFRANKTAVFVALLTIALLAWPFKFFENKEQPTLIEQAK